MVCRWGYLSFSSAVEGGGEFAAARQNGCPWNEETLLVSTLDGRSAKDLNLGALGLPACSGP